MAALRRVGAAARAVRSALDEENGEQDIAGGDEPSVEIGLCKFHELESDELDEAEAEYFPVLVGGTIASVGSATHSGDEGRIMCLQVTPEDLSMNLDMQGAGGDEGRITGLQVTSEVWSMNSVLQVAGGDEGRIKDLQVTSEVSSMSKVLAATKAASRASPPRTTARTTSTLRW